MTLPHRPHARAANICSIPRRRTLFRLAEMPSEPTLPRDEFDVVFDEMMVELFGPDPDGNEIVPQKLAKLFPGSPSEQRGCSATREEAMKDFKAQ